jgi:cysteinyl-tRNA synthetase
MIEAAEKRGDLDKSKTVLEATSGNTGIGLALVCAVKGYRLRLAMSESASEERKTILRAYGAELVLTPSSLGTDGAIEYVYNLAREAPDRYFLVDQYNNPDNWRSHYETTAPEILAQTGGRLDAVVVCLGTTGTIMGIARRFKEEKPKVRIVAIEPNPGHKIQGLKNMKESYKPGIFDESLVDEVIHVTDQEAFDTTRRLAHMEGLFVGISSGAAVAGALKLAKDLKSGTVVTILPDFGERYLSTPVFRKDRTDDRKAGPFIYNTLARKKEPLQTTAGKKIRMYTCGPTVDSYMHLGLCRRFVTADIVRRYLEYKGLEVYHVINITDLDDRTITAAEEAGIPLARLTETYLQAFWEDGDQLNLRRASVYPRVTENIDEMIALAGKLVQNGTAYEKFRSVYFDVTRFRNYGKLSGIDPGKVRPGVTVDMDQYDKNHPGDFTLFKRATLNELKQGICYPTEWGNGRPGWHLECPAIALKYLGESFDIHTGDANLIFPHHENEIAVAEACTGKQLCRFWIHNAPVLYQGKMMSDQSEEVVTLRDLLDKGYSGRQVRYYLLTNHYRKALNFSYESLDAFCKAMKKVDALVAMLPEARPKKHGAAMNALAKEAIRGFEAALEDDFNTPKAVAVLFEVIRKVNNGGLTKGDREDIAAALRRMDTVLGVLNDAEAA